MYGTVARVKIDPAKDEGHNYSDGLGMLMQLGHLPAPA
jgi:hypothetical protein